MKVTRDNGVVLTVDAPATTDANQYVQSARLDGADLSRSWLPESFVRTGGTLSLTMGSAPSAWGTATANRPPDRTGTGPVTLVQLDKCLDVSNSGTANGTKIQIWGCNGTGAQQWTVPGDGTVRALGKCLDVANSGTTNGSKLQLYDCNGTGAQQWAFVSATQALRNPQSGRCLDDPSSSTANGTQLQLWDCNATNAQRVAIPS
ncbi:ricin-type beta-trefoil lectin domain protein [Dactylosporangium sp. NPDC000244]|uniref:ricin-type beta-trefoil lectin domain protein n=1 Tax=Dactylosporangium sp. NPDC000244 TaxID=3154365 RepID=UPI0033271CB5